MCWEQGSERLYLSVYIMAHVNMHTHRHRGARQLQGAHHCTSTLISYPARLLGLEGL